MASDLVNDMTNYPQWVYCSDEWWPFRTFRGNVVGSGCMTLGVEGPQFCLVTDIACDPEEGFLGIWRCQYPCLDKSMTLMWTWMSFNSALQGQKSRKGSWGDRACVSWRLEVSVSPPASFLLALLPPGVPAGCPGLWPILSLPTLRHPLWFTDMPSVRHCVTNSCPVPGGCMGKTWALRAQCDLDEGPQLL